jgi:hypothetical protein
MYKTDQLRNATVSYTACNPAAIAGLLKSPHAAQWRARLPEIVVEIPHAPHICQPYNNTIASTTYVLHGHTILRCVAVCVRALGGCR